MDWPPWLWACDLHIAQRRRPKLVFQRRRHIFRAWVPLVFSLVYLQCFVLASYLSHFSWIQLYRCRIIRTQCDNLVWKMIKRKCNETGLLKSWSTVLDMKPPSAVWDATASDVTVYVTPHPNFERLQIVSCVIHFWCIYLFICYWDKIHCKKST